MFPEMDHPGAGKMRLTNNALKFTNESADPNRPAPTLGQDNDQVYGQFLGLDAEKISQLKTSGVI